MNDDADVFSDDASLAANTRPSTSAESHNGRYARDDQLASFCAGFAILAFCSFTATLLIGVLPIILAYVTVPNSQQIFSFLMDTVLLGVAAILLVSHTVSPNWRGPLLVRFGMSAVLIALSYLGLAIGPSLATGRSGVVGGLENSIVYVVATLAGAMLVCTATQIGLGWNLSERRRAATYVSVVSIRNLLEITLTASLFCVLLRVLAKEGQAMSLVISFLVGMAIGLMGCVRSMALSPQPSTRRTGILVSSLLFGGLIFVVLMFGFRSTAVTADDALFILLRVVLMTGLFLLVSAIPLMLLRRSGWQLMSRQRGGHATVPK